MLMFQCGFEGKKSQIGMRKGYLVIADHPESESSILTRFYGIVLDISQAGRVIIELADGSVIERQTNSIAVYVHPPSNWQELFKRQEVRFIRALALNMGWKSKKSEGRDKRRNPKIDYLPLRTTRFPYLAFCVFQLSVTMWYAIARYAIYLHSLGDVIDSLCHITFLSYSSTP